VPHDVVRHAVQPQATVKVFRDAGRQLRPAFVGRHHLCRLVLRAPRPRRSNVSGRGQRSSVRLSSRPSCQCSQRTTLVLSEMCWPPRTRTAGVGGGAPGPPGDAEADLLVGPGRGHPGVPDWSASDRRGIPTSREDVHMPQFIKVAQTTDLASGAAKCVEVPGKKIAPFTWRGAFTPSTTPARTAAARSVRAR
jgi:hypothetical protein